MSSPTTRASNIWPVEGGDDILQITGQGGAVLGGITAGGAGFGALAGGGGGTPGGSNQQIQFNNNGVFGGIPGAIYDSGTDTLTLATVSQLTGIGIGGSSENINIIASDSSPNGGQVVIQSASFMSLDAGGDFQFSGSGVATIVANSDATIQSISGRVILQGSTATSVVGLQIFANNAAAISGGLAVNDLYRTGADPDVVCAVH